MDTNGDAPSVDTASHEIPVTRENGPEVPRNLTALGLPASMVMDLVLRFLKEHGTVSLTSLSRGLKLSFPIADMAFQQLRQQQLINVKGTIGTDYMFSLTEAGQNLATQRSHACQYAGPAPVPLEQYTRVVRSQRIRLHPTREELAEAFADLVVPASVLDQLGPALTSGRPIFVYGPSGNGKTSIIARLHRLFQDSILVPYCVEVDGHIVSVFDPSVHAQLEGEHDEQADPRWLRCRRPSIMAGAELVPELLSLRMDPHSGVYAAPLQMKATNGVFAIDDFGRQPVSALNLFNRWILPLDRGIDNLSLQYGYMFRVPFDVILVFSTNLRPGDLADEAFSRRVPNKIYMDVTPQVFDQIFEQVFVRKGVPFQPELASYLRSLCREHGGADLRACYPGDICEILASQAAYERKPFAASAQNLTRAARLYFLQEESVRKFSGQTS